MGNTYPKEASMGNALRCCKCNKVLPPCYNWADFVRQTVHGRDVYVFNGGEYYRPCGYNESYECAYCFHKPIRDAERMKEEERKKREEERRREEERKKREEERKREEKKKQELNQRLQQSLQQAEEQSEKELNLSVVEEQQSNKTVLCGSLEEFKNFHQSVPNCDEFLQILSSKCNIEVTKLSLSKLSSAQLGEIVLALGELLFDEWISVSPSVSTLQHAQVFITELCVLSMEISEQDSLEVICNNIQSLVSSISQSTLNTSENLMLTQALFLTLMHFSDEGETSSIDTVFIPKQWVEDDFSATEFLSVLLSSLDETIRTTNEYMLDTEICCLKLLLSTLKHGNSESTEIILRLVKTYKWSPVEVLNLLESLSQKCTSEVSMTKILTLIQAYGISPDWTDVYGNSLIQSFDSIDPERFYQDVLKLLRRADERSLVTSLVELKISHDLDEAMIDWIKNIIIGVLGYSEGPLKDDLRYASIIEDEMQIWLLQLCWAVFETKGWWPTVRHMMEWCALVMKTNPGMPQLVDFKKDLCAVAMFSAMQVLIGNKVGLVLNSDWQSEEQIEEWSDFFGELQISLNSKVRMKDAALQSVGEADVVYGSVHDFVSDYFQHGIQAMDTGTPPLQHVLLIDVEILNSSPNLELSKLRNDHSFLLAADVLQTFMEDFQKQEMNQRYSLMMALFQVINSNFNENKNTECKIINILKKITGKELSPNEVFFLMFFEQLLGKFPPVNDTVKNPSTPAEKCILRILFTHVRNLPDQEEEIKDIFSMVSDLQAQTLWSPNETLSLLETLTEHHYDKGCTSIMKLLHLMVTYQVSSNWRDENGQSLLTLLTSRQTKSLIQQIEKSLKGEKAKDIETVLEEICQMKEVDEETILKTQRIVTGATNLIDKQQFEKVQKLRNLSDSMEIEDLQKLLAVLCEAVHLKVAGGKWWPRVTQMISWCLLALSDTGKHLEMGTGEGKSCVIAMFAALRVLRGEKVDVVSTSSVLCQRDAEEWGEFYKHLGITVDTNTNKTADKERKKCYQKDVVYGTIETFAADHLRQTFEMKDVRPERGYHCIIIDEVDSLMLDQGVQLTYLASPMVSMQHLNPVLAMIWSHVSQYGFLSAEHQTFVQAPPAPFFKTIYDSIDTEGSEIKEAMDILTLAEETETVPKGFREEICKSKAEELPGKLRTVSQDAVLSFFEKLEDYVPYGFDVYSLNDDGLLCVRKLSPYNRNDIPPLRFLVLDDGLCCALYESEEILLQPITEIISDMIQYTPCENKQDKVSIPGFLRNLIEKKLSAWIQNAFLATQLREGRDYVVGENTVSPVDFRSTGIVELNKKWGDGLQQFIEIKHQVKLSTLSVVTNYLSNISFFNKYQGKIYGTTGTLGSQQELQFVQNLYPNISACKVPSFNRKKLHEVKGIVKNSIEEWKSEIKRVVMAETSKNPYRDGRAVLVICETINQANEISEELKSSVPGELILYCRNDKDSLSKIEKRLLPGDVIVATNLAGRGTDIKVSEQVNNNGGLFVILSFLSESTRVELQAFGRTARKGQPGSAQIIMSTARMQQDFRTVTSVVEAKKQRDRLAEERMTNTMNNVDEMNLREELFAEYCKSLQDLYKNTNEEEKRAVVATLNEFWGIWLQIKSKEIDQVKRDELIQSLKKDLEIAKNQSEQQISPCSSIYHYINFGNIALDEKKWDVSATLLEKAMSKDESWAAVAFYNHAYCTIKLQKDGYLTKAKEDLQKALESLKYLIEEAVVCTQFVKMASVNSNKAEITGLEKQSMARCNMYGNLEKNITEAMQKLDEIKEKGRDAQVKKSPVFLLVPKDDKDLQEEADNLYRRGLQYAFTVEEKPRFSWEGLLIFGLGLLQIIGGALITAFSFGTLAEVGIGLIVEGVSDCIDGIVAMVTGEFSWKSWAIEKAISIGLSMVTFGVGKLVSKGFKATKMLIKGLGKELKALPKAIKEISSDVAKETMREAAKHTVKKVAEEVIVYGLTKAEEEILKQILVLIKNEVKKGITNDVKSKLENGALNDSVESIILLQIEEKGQLCYLDNENRRDSLLEIFKELINNSIQPFTKDLYWQQRVNSAIMTVTNAAKGEAKGKLRLILTAWQTTHYLILAADAIKAVLDLSANFFSKLQEQLKIFEEKNSHSNKIKKSELSVSDTEILRRIKEDISNCICDSIADALVEVFHQKFTSHITSHFQSEINGVLRKHVIRAGFKTDKTHEKLLAGQNNRYIRNMTLKLGSELEENAGNGSSISHAKNIKNPETAGTILDVRVLSEATGTKVVILTEDRKGKLKKMQEVNPSTKPSTQTVTLIYRPKSTQHPDGHYDVFIGNKTVSVYNKDKNCLFHAVARGMKPSASEEQIISEANRLRSVEADTLSKHPSKWDSFIECKERMERIRGGSWYLAEGAVPLNTEEDKETFRELIGMVKPYRKAAEEKRKLKMGQDINADHQPPYASLRDAFQKHQNSKLAKAMFEVGAGCQPMDEVQWKRMEKAHGPEFPTVNVPTEIHREFPSTKSPNFRDMVAESIGKDDVVGAFKLTIIGSMPRCMVDSTKNFKNFQSDDDLAFKLDVFKGTFKKHSEANVSHWFEQLKGKNVMSEKDRDTLHQWIQNEGYKDQNDPYRSQVANLLKEDKKSAPRPNRKRARKPKESLPVQIRKPCKEKHKNQDQNTTNEE